MSMPILWAFRTKIKERSDVDRAILRRLTAVETLPKYEEYLCRWIVTLPQYEECLCRYDNSTTTV
jgi:hypothetical protein